MKRKICLLLAMLLLLSAVLGLSSCKKDGEGDGGEETTVSTTGNGGGDGVENSKLYERLPTGDYDGYTFTMLVAQSDYAITTMVPTETSESLNQAIFRRNSTVKERLNINIVEESRPVPAYNTVLSEVRKLNSTNDFAYDVVFNEVAYQTPLAQEGAYFAVDEYEAYIDLNNPWWFSDAMDSLKIGGRTCELFGDLHLMYYDSIYAFAFNQKMFMDSHIEFPYELVREGKWTMSEFKEILNTVYAAAEDNHYGVAGVNNFSWAMLTSMGFSLIEQDDAEGLVPYNDDETFVLIYEELLDLYRSNGDGQDNWLMAAKESAAYESGAFTEEMANGGTNGGAYGAFIDGRAAFLGTTIGGLRRVRNASFDYGIVPMPKYNTDQRKYVNYIYSGAASCGIPISSPDLERTCVILENLSAYSHMYVKNEYYEIVVQLRTVRDNDSLEMLDVVFGHSDNSTTKFELDQVYALGFSGVVRINLSDAVAEIKHSMDSIKTSTVASNIKKVIDAYKE
ncbi:MAG: hypothetical protein IJV72_00220 [Clostridia bacterium]|nr:hypothetical protein [Clostridia bacterium]